MKKSFVLFLTILYVSSIHLSAQKTENVPVGGGYPVTAEGAWCWFADPRALHYENESGTINKTYIGYIDIHGNIKAMQYDFKKKKQEEVLIRSYFQPDDHNNPTFLVLPDERIMIFYSRHTDEACFYYRISQIPGDITMLGEEKVIKTRNNTTYPSPFILSDDPEHIYLCWRGIGWHPTIAKLSLPDEKDDVSIVWGAYQIVKSTGARPYAKYVSNGKDKIYLTYTTGHPDNENPNFLYFNYIDIHTMQLKDVKGNTLSTIADGTFRVNKTPDYVARYPYTVVDNPVERDWVWQVALDKRGYPVIAMVRISSDKKSHDYYYAGWDGREWKKTFLANAGGHFHQTPNLEKCYSAGMAIDPANTSLIYCSLPIEGKYGKVYEIVKYTLDEDGKIISTEAITRNSQLNNVRPYIIPSSENTPLRLAWMYGNYYDWIVSSQYPQGYCTGIACDFKGFTAAIKKKAKVGKNFSFNPRKDFTLEETVPLDVNNYEGCLLQLGDLEYYLDGQTMKPEVRYKGKVYHSTNILGTADCWKMTSRSTGGKWYAPQKYENVRLRIEYKRGTLCIYINDLLDQKIKIR
ncbi:BNR repeat-containing protein [Bacteroides thetaiotaomicron]|uniref:BNR repeat-containing protein n=1 Tax=Bacteroides thetaiotaomicron TaxID=818 RepID=UPI0028F3FBD7|nr:BNR repeat-containing protein [Bacteroides thetaiotaomicron]WOG18753.1 BNR repeat-containing protein [Bacteroides thetaiotaomicron]